jgi:putative transposase
MVTRRVTFRLYPTRQQEAQLHRWRRMHCNLYNAALADRKTSYQKLGVSVSYLDQQNRLPEFKKVWPEYVELGSHALQATLKRVDFAYSRFFKGLGGYPKFKAARRFSGWTYPCSAGWKAQTDGKHGQLSLTNLGVVRMRGQARTWGTPTTCTIMFKHGVWYASITVNCVPTRETGSGSVGIDLGCKEAVTFSNGEQISKPAFIALGDQAVKQASKKLRRKRAPNKTKRVKASRRWKKAQAAKSKLQRKVTRQRENWLHQITSDIVRGNSLIAGEQLNTKGMTRKAKKGSKRKAQKAGLNRSILSVGFGMIGKMLEYKSAEAGGFYVESPTRTLKPSQRCVKCWELTPKTLSDRIHVCQHCGHTEDRDVNAAQVNLAWARGQELASLVAESASSTVCGSMRQLAALKRQKPRTS